MSEKRLNEEKKWQQRRLSQKKIGIGHPNQKPFFTTVHVCVRGVMYQ